MGVFLSRQRDFSDNCLYVECAVGGHKKAGADILTTRYPMEGKNYTDPRDAIRLAEEMYRLWEHQYADEQKKLRIVGIETPLIFDFTTKGIAAAKGWADRSFAKMEKCSSCQKPMGNREQLEHADLTNQVFCCSLCLSNKYRAIYGTEPEKITAGKKKKGIGKI